MKQLPPLEIHPQGYSSFVTNAGIKDETDDIGIIVSEKPASAAALFTQNAVLGAPIYVGREHLKSGKIRAVIVNSKNANVATGKEGIKNSEKVCKMVAKQIDAKKKQVFPSSTGVIGRQLPLDKIEKGLEGFSDELITPARFDEFARAIMTTDTYAKYVVRRIENATLVGVAKGSGMIEPNMATMLAYFFTDADISSKKLRKMLQEVVPSTFNSLSVDADMSTSDTVFIMANGKAGKVSNKSFRKALKQCATGLTRMLARDGEGATKLFTVDVIHAESKKMAKRIGKSIINSPLVKTAIYKGDPNWGRIVMAIGKTKGVEVLPDHLKLLWGEDRREYKEDELDQLHDYLANTEEIILTVDMNNGDGSWRVYGCDLTEEYVRINAYYTT